MDINGWTNLGITKFIDLEDGKCFSFADDANKCRLYMKCNIDSSNKKGYVQLETGTMHTCSVEDKDRVVIPVNASVVIKP